MRRSASISSSSSSLTVPSRTPTNPDLVITPAPAVRVRTHLTDTYHPNPHVVTPDGRVDPQPHVQEDEGWCATPLLKLPYFIAHFLGHRREPPPPIHPFLTICWAFIGIVCSISLIAVVADRVSAFRDNESPVIVASFGAAAVLEFYAIQSPLSQPRNAILSQVIASVLGVSISKLFSLGHHHQHIQSLRWVGGALSCATATAIMALTGTVHPPAGATALLAVVDPTSMNLGWYLVPLVLLSCCLMLVVALLVNNVQRQFPLYWWSPGSGEMTRRKNNNNKKTAGGAVEAAGELGQASALEAGEMKSGPNAS